jgi:hypothetical protein
MDSTCFHIHRGGFTRAASHRGLLVVTASSSRTCHTLSTKVQCRVQCRVKCRVKCRAQCLPGAAASSPYSKAPYLPWSTGGSQPGSPRHLSGDPKAARPRLLRPIAASDCCVRLLRPIAASDCCVRLLRPIAASDALSTVQWTNPTLTRTLHGRLSLSLHVDFSWPR